MRTILFFALFIFLFLPQTAQSQSVTQDSFTVAQVSNGFSDQWTGPDFLMDSTWYLRGWNYIISAWLYPGNYFEENCPDDMLCGIELITEVGPNGDTIVYAVPADSIIIIGDWDCRGFFSDNGGTEVNFGIFDGDAIPNEHSTQTFTFPPTQLEGSPCPEGCFIVTDGPIICNEVDENGFCICKARVISGGTDHLKYMRGEVNLLISESKSDSIGGWPNVLFDFKHSLLVEEEATYLRNLNVSVKGLSTHIEHSDWPIPTDLIGQPQYGDNVTLEGVIYADSTFFINGPNTGINANGYAEWDSIGTWIGRGWWISKDHNLNDGYFVAGKHFFEFNDPELGQLQIMTDGRDQAILNVPVPQAVTGATDALFGHKGQNIQTIVGQNTSGGWNFTHSLSTARFKFTTGVDEIPQNILPLTMNIYPNPAADYLTVNLDQISEKGQYRIDIIDATGKLLYYQTIELDEQDYQTQVQLSSFPEGWYGIVLNKDGLVRGSKGFTILR